MTASPTDHYLARDARATDILTRRHLIGESMSTVAENLKGIADLPSPKGLPVLGNMFQLEIERLHLQLEK